MADRKKIGLLFSISDGWIGGSYYFLNIISALKNLPDDRRPELIIYSTDKSGYEAANELNYPYLTYKNAALPYTFLEKAINKISRTLLNRNVITKRVPSVEMLVLFGYYEQLMIHSANRRVFWIPDFQEHYHPDFIGQDVTRERKKRQLQLIKQKAEFVFSSESALLDFKTIYPKNTCKTSVVKFAVTHPDFSSISIFNLKKKYGFGDVYFFTPNQFWPHKNHLIVLKAMAVLKARDIAINVVFSGKINETDPHVKSLRDFIETHQLKNNVLFLGFIPREDQLCIMKNARAVIQPSFFEGWSTVVEDAKAMGKYIIASDLVVHKEQLSNYNTDFFDPNDEKALAVSIEKLLISEPKAASINYQEKIIAFAEDFLNTMS